MFFHVILCQILKSVLHSFAKSISFANVTVFFAMLQKGSCSFYLSAWLVNVKTYFFLFIFRSETKTLSYLPPILENEYNRARKNICKQK